MSKFGKEGKSQGKEGNNQEKEEKEEKSGRKCKNREGSFTLPLLTERAGYTTSVSADAVLLFCAWLLFTDDFTTQKLVVWQLWVCLGNCKRFQLYLTMTSASIAFNCRSLNGQVLNRGFEVGPQYRIQYFTYQ